MWICHRASSAPGCWVLDYVFITPSAGFALCSTSLTVRLIVIGGGSWRGPGDNAGRRGFGKWPFMNVLPREGVEKHAKLSTWPQGRRWAIKLSLGKFLNSQYKIRYARWNCYLFFVTPDGVFLKKSPKKVFGGTKTCLKMVTSSARWRGKNVHI
jgi:hypothetical protein